MVNCIFIEQELLEALYWGLDYDLSEIAKIFGCNRYTVRNKMIAYGIEIKPYIIPDEIRRKKSISMIGKNKGRIHSEEIRKKFSESHKGQKAWNKGLTAETNLIIRNCAEKRLGGKRSIESKRKMSESHIGMFVGANHPNWKGGISFEPYGIEFNEQLRKQTRKRDNFTCQECGFTEEQLGYTLCVHHIDYNKKNNSGDNLISLCRSCHAQTNFDRNDWKNYFFKRRANA